MAKCLNGLNKFLLVIFFIGIMFILMKEKEGFGYALDDAYNGAFLKHYVTNENPQQVLASNTLNNQRSEYINKLKNINTLKKESNNVKYPKIPCSHEDYDYGICNALYKETILAPKEKYCRPGFDCTRVGFYCSKIDE